MLLGSLLAADPATAFQWHDMGNTSLSATPVVHNGALAAKITCVFRVWNWVTEDLVGRTHRKQRSLRIYEVLEGEDNRLISNEEYGSGTGAPSGHAGPPWTANETMTWIGYDDQAYDFSSVTRRTYQCEIRYNRVVEYSDFGKLRVKYNVGEYRVATRDERVNTGLPAPPDNIRFTDELAAHDRVKIRWDEVSHTGRGALPVTGYSVRRHDGGGWRTIGTVDGHDTTEFVDDAPHAGNVRYSLRTESFASSNEVPLAERRYTAWKDDIYVHITPLTIQGLSAPRSVTVTPVAAASRDASPDAYRLSWDTPWDGSVNRRYGSRRYEVRTQTGRGEIVTQPLVNGTSFTVSSPTPGERYSFWVSTVREESGTITERAAVSPRTNIGTETAPFVRELEAGTGWVRLGWDPGPLNGNGAPPDRTDWFIRYREQGEARWRTIPDIGGPDTRETTVALRGVFLGTDSTARRYEVEVAAENATGVGVFGRVVTSEITPATSGASGDSPVFNHGGTGITWHLEGPTNVRLGETATWTVRARRNDGSATPITELMGRPVGVRENQNSTRALVELDNPNTDCDHANVPNAATVNKDYMLCLHLADALPGWSNGRSQFRQSQSGDPAFIAYYPTIDRSASPWTGGVPAGHEMQVTIRDDARFLGQTFDAVIGVRSGGVELGELSLRNQSRALTVTVVRSVPYPPRNLQVSEVEVDGSPRWRLTWNPSPNAEAAGVDDYELYRDINGQGFSRVTGISTVNRTFDQTAHDGTTYAFYVVATNPDGQTSLPSNTVRVGLPAPPTDVQAEAFASAVQLTWAASPSSFTTGYRIEYSTDGTSWTRLESSWTGTSYTHSGVSNPEGAHYRVTPVSARGDGRSGNIAVATQSDAIPVLTITRQSASPMGEGGSAVFNLTADQNPLDNLEGIVLITGGEAFGVDEASETTRTVSFRAGDTAATLTVETENDDIDDTNATLTATVQPGLGYEVGTPSSATVTITNVVLAVPDVNDDDEVNANDALILYYAYSLGSSLGNGR